MHGAKQILAVIVNCNLNIFESKNVNYIQSQCNVMVK